MIPKEPPKVTNNLGNMESNKFSIAVNAKSFRILLDGLYTNKIRAVIRELWTNALDSHIQAGYGDRPFSCKLPGSLDPTFSVRDYGVSLTHDDLMVLYTTLFESSKEGTNDLVGQLGLGSKSPFAYTDSFSIVAWLDGEKRSYLASLDEAGIPQITHLLTESSDEENGLEVSFAAKSKDFQEFSTEARNVARGFDVLPITGHNMDGIKPIYADGNWRIYAGGNSGGVRQGCVIYPVQQTQVSYDDPTSYSYSVVVDVPIGAVSITPSRESLSLDDETKENVRAAFRQATKDIKAWVQAQIEDASNFLEATQRWRDWSQVMGYNQVPNKYRGRTIDGYIRLECKDKNVPKIINHKGDSLAGGSAANKQIIFNVSDLRHMKFVVDRGQPLIRKAKRLQQFYKGNTGKRYKIVDPDNKQLEAFIRRLGLTKEQIVSVMALPDPGAVVSNGGKKSGVYHKASNHTNWLSKIEIDPEVEPGEYYWVGIDKGVPSGNLLLPKLNQGWTVENCGVLDAAMKELDIPARKVYYLTSNARKRWDVQESDSLDAVLAEKSATMRDNIKVATVIDMVWRLMRVNVTVGPDAERILKRILPGLDIDKWQKYKQGGTCSVIRNHSFAAIEEGSKLGRAIADKLSNEYPLLFNADPQQINDYITLKGEPKNAISMLNI